MFIRMPQPSNDLSWLDVEHDVAMLLASSSDRARLSGNTEQANSLARKALEKECEVADALASHENLEPSRSIIHLSAASLAVICEEIGIAKRLATQGLAGSPSRDVARQLKCILQLDE